ncbi:MAG: hypothetical protein ACR2KJ_05505 [Jatrophihabitans sp.]
MPRQNRRTAAEPRQVRAVGAQREEEFGGRTCIVRTVAASDRTYRCPGCDQEIVRIPHVVAWPADELDAANRRHWHAPCWAARDTRRPVLRRAGRGPGTK